MKHSIQGNDSSLCMQIVKLVTFNAKWIANENTWNGFRVKFSPMSGQSGNISKATKNSKM